MAEHEWATERRVDDEKGVVVCRCGETFEYDVEGLGEYSIEKNRRDAVDAVEEHIEDERHRAQFHFDRGEDSADGDGSSPQQEKSDDQAPLSASAAKN